MVYFSTKEVSSNHPPADKDEGFLSIMCMRYLQKQVTATQAQADKS